MFFPSFSGQVRWRSWGACEAEPVGREASSIKALNETRNWCQSTNWLLREATSEALCWLIDAWSGHSSVVRNNRITYMLASSLHTLYVSHCFQLHFNGNISGEPISLSSHFSPSLVLEDNHCRINGTRFLQSGFYTSDALPISKWTISKHCRKLRALSPCWENQTLATSFLCSTPDSSRKGCCFLYAGF